MKQVPLVVLRVDGSGRVIAATPGAEAFLGPVIGRPCRSVVCAAQRDGQPICSADCAAAVGSSDVVHDVRGVVIRDRVGRLTCARAGDETVVVVEAGPLRAHQYPERLTARERQVLTAIADGCTNRQIASVLGVAPSTVRTHVEHVLEKLGAASRAEAVASARDLGEIV
jgi:DNA-binding CsgD family transcriptional regulator